MKDKCPYYRADDEGYYFCTQRMMLTAAATIDELYRIVAEYKAVYGNLKSMQEVGRI